jgi:CRP-like cAMP-binding protein
MNNPIDNFFKLLRGREIQLKAVILTALASYVMQLSAILLHWHLWAIGLVTILPWIPLFTMKILWTSKHYGFMAIYLVLMLVQAGHVGEHVFQMAEYIIYHESREPFVETTTVKIVKGQDGTPLLDNQKHVVINPAIPASDGFVIQDSGSSTGFTEVKYPGCKGWSWNGPGCGSAHGVFGELDRELIHFIWDGMILIACTVLFLKFPKNPWTKWALLAAAIHQIEHIFLFGISVFDYQNYLFVPADASAGKAIPTYFGIKTLHPDQGLLGHDGVIACLTGCSTNPAQNGVLNSILPNRINIHFIYNTLVFLPMVGAFVYQLRRIYDEWLAKSIPQLSEEQLIAATSRAENVKFAPGQVIFKQGDPADKLYIITKGNVQVLRRDRKKGTEAELARLGPGQFFGEIGVLGRTERTATVQAVDSVEALALDRELFKALLVESGAAYKDVDVILRRRLVQMGAAKGLAVADSVNADPDTVLKTRMIRDRLQMIQGDELSRVLGALPSDLAFYQQQPPLQPQPAQPRPQFVPATRPDPAVAVVERPATPVPNYNGGFHRGALLVRTGTSAGMRFEINSPRVLVGRRSSNAPTDVPVMQVDDGRVSRQHLEVVAQPDGLYIRDLGSANGTWLNGRQIGGEPIRISDGAEIRLGTDTVLTFLAN